MTSHTLGFIRGHDIVGRIVKLCLVRALANADLAFDTLLGIAFDDEIMIIFMRFTIKHDSLPFIKKAPQHYPIRGLKKSDVTTR